MRTWQRRLFLSNKQLHHGDREGFVRVRLVVMPERMIPMTVHVNGIGRRAPKDNLSEVSPNLRENYGGGSSEL